MLLWGGVFSYSQKIPCLKHLSKSKFKIIPPATQIETAYFFQQWSFMWNTHHSPRVSKQKKIPKNSDFSREELEEEQQEVQKLLQRTGKLWDILTSCRRDPGSPKLRMVSWNLWIPFWAGDWTSLAHHYLKIWLETARTGISKYPWTPTTHGKRKFYTPNTWVITVITSKNECFGFPWKVFFRYRSSVRCSWGHPRGAGSDPAAPVLPKGRILGVRRSCVSILGTKKKRRGELVCTKALLGKLTV